MVALRWFPVFVLLSAVSWTTAAAQRPLTRLEPCTLVPAEWADGDSFPVRTPDGNVRTIRLYGADCLEWHIGDDSDSRRLREQRRYFGISLHGGTAQASIGLAKQYGQTAGERVVELLQQPFTVHTAFSDARGDGRYERVYGFVRLADGRDLSATLVEEGLARAFGVVRETPEGESHEDYREQLRDLELQAAKLGRGVWAHTDWNALPAQRKEQRDEEAELGLAADAAGIPEGFLLDPNTAARDDLMKLPGVGEVMANRIIEGRPFRTPEDLLAVPGIGPATLDKLRPYLQIRQSPRP